ncbi:PREDICTED: gamma-glutamyl hydrolase 2 isoform X2 [Fragaria vesca subsp. vesca]|uniref:gamma-glutamyl hydrolase 2 isoform X2 n=1 Tax=Fragaria vesca subsp. vesca TaxID=101020 RepID=UPI0002C3091E|nr:PREDICTED: gamma-glutamyl hydrolase 2 isoform X2 [Fragaria vesca subsp. vesca]
MPSPFLSNPTPTPPPESSSDAPNDAVPAAASSSSSRYSEMWNYLWIPFLISLSKELTSAKAQSAPAILLPSQLAASDSSSPRCTPLDPKLNYRPVIGILSHPGDGASGRLSNVTGTSYIAASYVKFVESAGARVIPLIYNEPSDVLFQKLNLVNGVLFTGGWAKSGRYYDVAEKIFKMILERNDAGDHFPLYAICLGFELLTMIISKNKKILESFSAADMASTLQFTENMNIEGTVFQRFPPDLLRKLSTDCIVMQNHHYGISPETLQQNPDLSSFFKILTTSTDEDDKVYVSTVHAYHYPVTAFQWHPEKNAFEWGLQMIPHSEDAIQVTQHIANFLVSEARKSLNRPPLQDVLDNLIYNYSPTFCGKAGKGYDEVYIFKQPSLAHL